MDVFLPWCAGVNVLWVVSTAILQTRVDCASQGIVFALELALYTTAICASTLLAGLGLDVGKLHIHQMSLAMAAVNTPITVCQLLRSCLRTVTMLLPSCAELCGTAGYYACLEQLPGCLP